MTTNSPGSQAAGMHSGGAFAGGNRGDRTAQGDYALTGPRVMPQPQQQPGQPGQQLGPNGQPIMPGGPAMAMPHPALAAFPGGTMSPLPNHSLPPGFQSAFPNSLTPQDRQLLFARALMGGT